MKKLPIFIIGLVIVTWSAFCFAGQSKPGRLMEARAGQSFTITLEANKTTGYEWQFTKLLDKRMVELISSDYVVDKTGLVGAGGRQVWVFKALRKGKTNISFKYVRPWEKDIPPVNEEFFVIIIKKQLK